MSDQIDQLFDKAARELNAGLSRRKAFFQLAKGAAAATLAGIFPRMAFGQNCYAHCRTLCQTSSGGIDFVCYRQCVNSDNSNCGSCGVQCPPDSVCSGGACAALECGTCYQCQGFDQDCTADCPDPCLARTVRQQASSDKPYQILTDYLKAQGFVPDLASSVAIAPSASGLQPSTLATEFTHATSGKTAVALYFPSSNESPIGITFQGGTFAEIAYIDTGDKFVVTNKPPTYYIDPSFSPDALGITCPKSCSAMCEAAADHFLTCAEKMAEACKGLPNKYATLTCRAIGAIGCTYGTSSACESACERLCPPECGDRQVKCGEICCGRCEICAISPSNPNGVCQPPVYNCGSDCCPPNTLCCNGACVTPCKGACPTDYSQDPSNCGSCGHKCSDWQICVDGACVDCPPCMTRAGAGFASSNVCEPLCMVCENCVPNPEYGLGFPPYMCEPAPCNDGCVSPYQCDCPQSMRVYNSKLDCTVYCPNGLACFADQCVPLQCH